MDRFVQTIGEGTQRPRSEEIQRGVGEDIMRSTCFEGFGGDHVVIIILLYL